jgi:hypothetical protein
MYSPLCCAADAWLRFLDGLILLVCTEGLVQDVIGYDRMLEVYAINHES